MEQIVPPHLTRAVVPCVCTLFVLVTIQGPMSFRGFFLQARSAESPYSNQLYGSFAAVNLSRVACKQYNVSDPILLRSINQGGINMNKVDNDVVFHFFSLKKTQNLII